MERLDDITLVLCRIARRHGYDHVITVESEETDCCGFRIPSLHPRIGYES